MLHDLKPLRGVTLGASDGDLGHVKDFLFDDQSWAVRYVVADTGSWLPGRQVLLSPHSLGHFPAGGKVLRVKLTRKQIEDSPSIDAHKPVSRQYEEEYYRYYGWPYYWRGESLWGMSGFPILEQGPPPFPGEPAPSAPPAPERADAHLRSANAVMGYVIQAKDGPSGQVLDFRVEDRSWAIRALVARIGHRFSGRECEIPTEAVERISWDESSVCLSLAREAVEKLPLPQEAPIGTPG